MRNTFLNAKPDTTYCKKSEENSSAKPKSKKVIWVDKSSTQTNIASVIPRLKKQSRKPIPNMHTQYKPIIKITQNIKQELEDVTYVKLSKNSNENANIEQNSSITDYLDQLEKISKSPDKGPKKRLNAGVALNYDPRFNNKIREDKFRLPFDRPDAFQPMKAPQNSTVTAKLSANGVIMITRKRRPKKQQDQNDFSPPK